MKKDSPLLICKVNLLTRQYKLVCLPLEVNGIIYWRPVLQDHMEKDF